MALPPLPPLPQYGWRTVSIQLAAQVVVEFDTTAAPGWGLNPGLWTLYDPEETPWTYRPWARWWVDDQRKARPLLVPTRDSPWDSQRLVLLGGGRSAETQDRPSILPSWASC